MKIKQDPITKLYCREDGAVLMPPAGRYRLFRWTFGTKYLNGYRMVRRKGKDYLAHQIVCRAFNGLAPEDKPFVDHINRIRDDNRPSNLHWVSPKENSDNAGSVDKSIETYGVRACEDLNAYSRARYEMHREEQRAYNRAYNEKHREEINARGRTHWAAKYAKMKAQGLTYRKGPSGKWGWYPKARPVKEAAACL